MNKRDLIDSLYRKLSVTYRYPKRELKAIIDPFLDIVLEALENGKEVRIPNFGKFSVKTRKGRNFYNARTKTRNITADKKIVVFTQHRRFKPK